MLRLVSLLLVAACATFGDASPRTDVAIGYLGIEYAHAERMEPPTLLDFDGELDADRPLWTTLSTGAIQRQP